MKKNLIYLTVVILALAGVFIGVTKQSSNKMTHIGVLQWTEHVSPFRQTREGILAGLKSMGLKEGENLTLTIHNADQNREKALEAIREFARQQVDLIITIGSSSTLIAMEEALPLPIVYTLVAAPKATGIIESNADSDRNLTGISMRVSALTQLKSVHKVLPDVTRLGVLYCTETLAAVTTGKETTSAAQALGWQVKTESFDLAGITTLEDKVTELATGVDAIYIPADSILNLPANMRRINNVTDPLGVPLICVGDEFVKDQLALMAVHCNFTETGKQVRNPVEKILGGVNARSIPSQNPLAHEMSINLAKARKLKIAIHRNAILLADNIYE